METIDLQENKSYLVKDKATKKIYVCDIEEATKCCIKYRFRLETDYKDIFHIVAGDLFTTKNFWTEKTEFFEQYIVLEEYNK